MESLSVERLHPPWRRHSGGRFPRSSSYTPFLSTPCSPYSGNVLLHTRSAPSSPPRHGWTDYDHSSGLQVAIPFSWEESPGTPKASLQKPEAIKDSESELSKDSESVLSKDSEFEFPSSLHRFSIENSVDNLSEMEFTYFSAPSTPGQDNFGRNKKFGGSEIQYDARDSSDGFEFAAKRSDEDSATSARMSSPDELFFQGLILPLKPPPRLQAVTLTGHGNARFRDKDFSNSSSATQSPKSAWKSWRSSGVCGFGSSCYHANPADIDIFLGMDNSFFRNSNRKEEWMKILSRVSFLRNCDKDAANLPSFQTSPKSQQTKSQSNYFQSQKQSDYFPTKSFGDVHGPEQMLHRNSYSNSKCSKNYSTLSVKLSLSKRWLNKPLGKCENGAKKSCSRSSDKSIQQHTSSSSLEDEHQQQHQLRQLLRQQKSADSNGVFPYELHYRPFRTSTEPRKRASILPFKKGIRGCFPFAIPGLSSRPDTAVVTWPPSIHGS